MSFELLLMALAVLWAAGSTLAVPRSCISPTLSIKKACNTANVPPVVEVPTTIPASLMPSAWLFAPPRVPIFSVISSGPVPVCLNPRDWAVEVDVPTIVPLLLILLGMVKVKPGREPRM